MSETRDYLKEDPPIYGQEWVCLSFLDPEDMVEKKIIHSINKFLCNNINQEISAMSVQMSKYINVMLRKQMEETFDRLMSSRNETDNRLYELLSEVFHEKILLDEDEVTNKCRRQYSIDNEEIMDKYKIFKVEHQMELDREFDDMYENAPSIRGFKVRGTYQDIRDAKDRCEFLRNEVEPAHHVFIAPVGKWTPWNPDPDSVRDQERGVSALNNLMKNYQDNVHQKNLHFKQRKEEMVERANMSNKDKQKQRMRDKLIARRNAKQRQELEKHLG